MHNNNIKTDIYLYDICKDICIRKFKDLNEVIDYLAKFKSGRLHWWDRKVKDNISYLDEINLNGNDLNNSCVLIEGNIEWCKTMRPYMFVDNNNRIIDMRIYREEINKRADDILKEYHSKEEKEQNLKRGEFLIRWRGGQPFRFRIDPVPGTGNFGHGSCYRHPKTTQEIRNNASDQYENYTRGKRRNLPTTYDDIYRSNGSSKSWKNQGKHRHQWQKNLK